MVFRLTAALLVSVGLHGQPIVADSGVFWGAQSRWADATAVDTNSRPARNALFNGITCGIGLLFLGISVLVGAMTVQADAQPRLLIQQPDARLGVLLRGSSDPFYSATLEPRRDRAGDPLPPYAVVLDNMSNVAIIGYAVRWVGVDASG